MTEPEQPEQPQLTRKQLRQIRDTAANPIIVPGTVPAVSSGASPSEAASSDVEVAESDVEALDAQTPPAPLPRAADPIDIARPPVADADVDLGVSPLTRRQARQQEQIRTASVPVITPDLAAQLGTASAPVPEPAEAVPDAETVPPASGASAPGAPAKDSTAADSESASTSSEAESRPTLAPSFGAELLAGEPAALTQPPSFDQLISRGTSTSGSSTASNALILSQTPDGALMGPVAATGEVLITGTYALPEGLGSHGHAPGTADGRDVDAVLVDGELPAHSSPTPIAASAAISTAKSTGEIIRPPAPEKGSRLMLTLAITAGVLALALVGVLILAFVTGVF